MSLEMRFRIYHEHSGGEYVEVCPDSDGLDMFEIRMREPDDKIVARITISDTMAQDMIVALTKLLEFRK